MAAPSQHAAAATWQWQLLLLAAHAAAEVVQALLPLLLTQPELEQV
jgi:hypothetical protein